MNAREAPSEKGRQKKKRAGVVGPQHDASAQPTWLQITSVSVYYLIIVLALSCCGNALCGVTVKF